MPTVRTLRICDTAGVSSWNPTTPGNYYGNAWVQTWGGTGYALVNLPGLADIPTVATIQSARLRWLMHDAVDPAYERSGTSSLTIRANRITADWVRSSVTWNTRPASTSADAPSVTNAFNQPGGWTPWWDVTTHVAGMVDGTYPQYGWLMEMTNYGGGVAFRNYGNAAELEVTYIAPASVTTDTPSGTADVPAEISNQVSGFNLTANFESEGDDPITSVTAQVYDADGNQAWEHIETYNALSGNQQSVETNTAGFAAVGGATISRDATRCWHGTHSLKVISAAAVGSGARIALAAPVVGQEYSARSMVSGPFTTEMELQLRAVNGAGTLLNAGAIQHTLLGNTSLTGCSQTAAKSWTEFAVEDVVAVADTAEMRIEVLTIDDTAPTVYLDGNILTPDVEVAPWVSDGQATFLVPLNTLEYGHLYSWRAIAENAAGSSGWSEQTYFICLLSPVAGLSAEGISGEALIRLLWDAHPGENLAGYRVYRALTGSPVALHSIDLVGAENRDDDAAENGAAYDYKVTPVAADGYEGPMSALVSGLVSFAGSWLGTLAIKVKTSPQITKPRLVSNRVALNGSMVTQDYGFGARHMELQIQYLLKSEKDSLYAVLAPAQALSYRDATGEVFRGRLGGPAHEQPYAVPGRMAGIVNVRLVEVLPVD